jgi:hypothetical protein
MTVGTVGHTRRSIARYRAWAQEQGLLLHAALPSAAEIHRLLAQTMPVTLPPQLTPTVAQYRQEILDCRARGMEVAATRGRLGEARLAVCTNVRYASMRHRARRSRPD